MNFPESVRSKSCIVIWLSLSVLLYTWLVFDMSNPGRDQLAILSTTGFPLTPQIMEAVSPSLAYTVPWNLVISAGTAMQELSFIVSYQLL